MRESGYSLELVEFATPEFDECLALRDEVLRKPLGLQYDPARIEAEFDQVCLSARDDSGMLMACLLLQPMDEKTMKMRQVAVHPGFQSKGIGSLLVAFSEDWASRHGYGMMELHARLTAVDFYLKSGYGVSGDTFTEVGIPHVRMYKPL